MPTAGQRGPADLAYRAGSDLDLLTRDLHRAHDAFVATGTPGAPLRPLVLESWRRCVSSGLDPEQTEAPWELDDAELARIRAEHPLFAAMPVVRRLLVDSAAEAGMLVAVSDAAGRLLWVEGSHRLRSLAEGIAFAPGANWSETAAGTNAPGTALALDAPVQIFGAEHLARPVTPWSCSAAPVHDPDTGALLGVLDLTGGPDVAAPQGLALVRATVAAVESELRLDRLTRPHPPTGSRPPATRSGHAVRGPGRRRPTQPDDVPATLTVLGRRRGLVRTAGTDDATTVELGLRHSEILVLLAAAGAGLSGDELAVRLSEEEMSAVTVRAEMSRLRSVLPGVRTASRPYRLESSVRTDLEEVRDELRAGRLRSAVAHYPGPVLPWSLAPGVVDLRDRLHHELRRALLTSGDPDALLGFADTEHGRDDLEVWRAALAALPAGSPRYAQVASHVDDLAVALA
ncbi:hypothetical protein FHX74_002742 [Friedmanniella endophytica]|uniref:GAF domain-containing protein n=1 Tax=Microlunatus kandeliicorticis TaxID=1759536 RepID=A0A7W3ITT4_9ACTN|nr:transcriptional regulator [Microlunatus kandeliicorticis]MBA8795114.1 hypothetical protein [Microlunatus kandeliicorticis]